MSCMHRKWFNPWFFLTLSISTVTLTPCLFAPSTDLNCAGMWNKINLPAEGHDHARIWLRGERSSAEEKQLVCEEASLWPNGLFILFLRSLRFEEMPGLEWHPPWLSSQEKGFFSRRCWLVQAAVWSVSVRVKHCECCQWSATCRATREIIQECHFPVPQMGRLAHLRIRGRTERCCRRTCHRQEGSVVQINFPAESGIASQGWAHLLQLAVDSDPCSPGSGVYFGLPSPCVWEGGGVSDTHTEDMLSALVTACLLPLCNFKVQCWEGKNILKSQ